MGLNCCVQFKFKVFLSPQRETLYPSAVTRVLFLTTYYKVFFFPTPDPVYWTAHVTGLISCVVFHYWLVPIQHFG